MNRSIQAEEAFGILKISAPQKNQGKTGNSIALHEL